MSLDTAGTYRYPSPDPEWLARRTEDILDPGLAIIDAHHHLWIEDGVPYLGAEIMDDLASGHRIEATVFVQAHYGYRQDGPAAMAPVGETEKVAAIAQACERAGCETRVAAGIVAFADLTLGKEVAAVLDAHEAAGDGRLRGVRHSVSRDPHYPEGIVLRPAPAGMLADPAYREGLRTLAARGLSYDAMLYHAQIPELTAMARAIPDLPIVCDHMGTLLGVGPYAERPQEAFDAWRKSMAELASCPNVTVKIGGFGMIICGAEWHLRPDPPGSEELALAWKDRFETCVELFGAERCMFESNFPVDKAMASYRTVWNAFKRLAAGASESEKSALFSRTATRVYRLERDPSDG